MPKAKNIIADLPDLVSLGVIDQDTADRLKSYYENLPDEPRGAGLSNLFAVGGVLLITIGVITLFAYNWDMLPKFLRIAISFIPIVASSAFGYWTILRSRGWLYSESASVLFTGSAALLIALVSQIYHVNGDFASYMQLVLTIALGAMYLFKSDCTFILYSSGLFALLGSDAVSDWFKLGDILILAPYIWDGFRHNRVVIRYASLIPVAFFTALSATAPHTALVTAVSTGTALYLIGLYGNIYATRKRNPWLIIGLLFILCLLVITTMVGTGAFSHRAGAFSPFSFIWLIPVVYALAAAATDRLLWFFMLFPAVSILSAYVLSPNASLWLFNVYFLVWGFYQFWLGDRIKSEFHVNAGLWVVLSFFLSKLFNLEIPILWKGAFFIASGIIFLIANIWLKKRLRNVKDN